MDIDEPASRRGGGKGGRGGGKGVPREAEEANFETSKGIKVCATFEQMGLKEELLRGAFGDKVKT